MADFIGTSGNDTFQNLGGGGSLTLVLAGTIAQGIWPTVNILVNGAVALANVSITANNMTGATQTLTVPVPASATSVAIQYTNDPQTDFWASGDRNVYIKSVSLNGVALQPTSASYALTNADGTVARTDPGRADMTVGGTMTWSDPTVASAAAAGGAGTNDTFNGLAGLDTVVYSGARAEYGIAAGSGGSFTVTHGSEVDSLVSIERLQFGNMKHALDMNAGAGTVAKLIATLFGESALGIKEYAGVGISLVDQGRTALQLADMAVSTSQFQQRAGSFTNEAFVSTVAANLGYTGDTSGFLADLNAGRTTKAALAVMAADYMASTMGSHATLMGVMQAGIDYV